MCDVRHAVYVCLLAGLASHAAAHAADVAARPSAGCAAPTLETGSRLQRSIEVDGRPRSYILDVPPRLQAHAAVPLLFDFHGFGHSAAGVWEVSEFRALAAHEGFITVYPDGLPVHLLGRDGPGWDIFTVDANRDLALTARLLDHLEQTYCIDRTRVFATGFSNGAFFTNLLACVMPERFAAIAPVSGGLTPGSCDVPRGVPVMIHHGRSDHTVDVKMARRIRDVWVERNGCAVLERTDCEWHRQCRNGADVAYCENDDGHRWPAEATARIWQFFRSHPLMGEHPAARAAR